MYLPPSFAETDEERLFAFLDQHSFCTLVTPTQDSPFASHLPFLLDRSRRVLLGHLARANPHLALLEGRDSLAIFSGPHGYISPSWYLTSPAVPTWNFTAVHVTGQVRLILDEHLLADIVDRLSRKYESSPSPSWLTHMPQDFYRSLLKGIVGLEMPLTRIQGKFKLSQNKPRPDRLRVIDHLQTGNDEQRRLAHAMREQLERTPPDPH